jgi:hypothetical protein
MKPLSLGEISFLLTAKQLAVSWSKDRCRQAYALLIMGILVEKIPSYKLCPAQVPSQKKKKKLAVEAI